ncbi:hypothetical protein H2204_003380 [Knufia peltigerae]|uniref:Xylanolytic transcriptional activator regulatory domain-containing protein n=1 Tax=Knufia peltigerae TaxID=1002370 RepID=A0AA38YAS0_9EURO|nr:hypothetical protein H2204_003380 [Knufia peltigerae]
MDDACLYAVAEAGKQESSRELDVVSNYLIHRKPPTWYSKATTNESNNQRSRGLPMSPSLGSRYSKPRHDSSLPQPWNNTSYGTLSSSNAADVLNSMVGLGDIPPKLKLFLSVKAPVVTPPAAEEYSPELPDYFLPFPDHLEERDLEYLRSKGAFVTPSPHLGNEIIRCYVEYMHPYMPLLDAERLLQMSRSASAMTPVPKYSLLLFQCVMFAAVAFVDEELVKQHGYDSLKCARKDFYLRTRRYQTLYDMDFESDRLTLVQSLLLMSLWCDNPDAHKQSWHWSGIAISLAQMIGLNRDPAALQIPPEQKTLRKRIWWCCFMRDRLISLGMSRPMRIRDGDFDTPFLRVEDFGPNGHAMSPVVSSESCHRSTGSSLTEIFIANLNLCVIVGSVLSAQYSTLREPSKAFLRSDGHTNTGGFAMLLPIPKSKSDECTNEHLVSAADLLDANLAEWLGSLPTSAHLLRQLSTFPRSNSAVEADHSQNLRAAAVDTQPSSIVVQCALVHMSYNTAVSALHRPRCQRPSSNLRVIEAANAISSICARLNERCLARYLPVNAITMLVPSIISNALILKSAMSKNRTPQGANLIDGDVEHTKRALNEVVISLSSLNQAYVGADVVISFVDAFLSSLKLKVVLSPNGNILPQTTGHQRLQVISMDNSSEMSHTAQALLPAATSQSASRPASKPEQPERSPDTALRRDSTNADINSYPGINMSEEWATSSTGLHGLSSESGQDSWFGMSDLSAFHGETPGHDLIADGMSGVFDWSNFNFDWPI